MKNTYFLKLSVACVATFAFIIGLQTSVVEAAVPEYPLENGNRQSYDQDHKTHSEVENVGEIFYIPENPQKVEMQATRPPIAITRKSIAQLVEKNPALSISNEEKDLLSRLVEAEAKGELYEGKVAVAIVVLNRVESPKFPNTVTDVVHEVVGNAYAFTPVQNGEIENEASVEAKQAVEEALTRKERLNESVYFYNPSIATDDWIRTRNVVKTIGNHVFAI